MKIKGLVLLRILSFVYLLVPILLKAQSVVGTFYPKNRPSDFVYKVSNPGKPIKLFFQNDSEYELLYIDSTFKFSKSLIQRQIDKKNRFVTSLETDSALNLYFINIKNGRFSALSSWYVDSGMVWKTLFEESENEHFLKAVPVNNKVCALSIDEPNKTLIVRSYINARLDSKDTFKVEFPQFIEALKSEVNMLNQEPFSDMGITYINYEVDQELANIYTDRKLYVKDNKLIMVFDETNISHLVIIDLEKKKSYYKKFSFKLEIETSSKTNKGNSYLFKDYFFRVTTNGHQLNLAVIDFRSFSLVRNHNIYDEKDITIKNGPLLLEESSNGSIPKVEAIKNTEKFFKFLRGADLGVTARRLSNGLYELTIGSHLMEVYVAPIVGPSMTMGMGMGMGFGMGYGIGPGAGIYDPFYYPYGMSTRGYSVSIEKAYFHSILTEKEFAHVPIPLQNGYHEKKKTFWARNFKSGRIPEISVEYRWKNNIHYGYWDKKTTRFQIVEFKD